MRIITVLVLVAWVSTASLALLARHHTGSTQAYEYVCVEQTWPVGPKPPRVCAPIPVAGVR